MENEDKCEDAKYGLKILNFLTNETEQLKKITTSMTKQRDERTGSRNKQKKKIIKTKIKNIKQSK